MLIDIQALRTFLAATDKRYMKLTTGSGGTSGGASISVGNTGSMSNFSDNGQAFNAVRDCGTNSITGKPINAASFGVKLDGTTAFSHKTYNSFTASTGAYTGARNTAVLTFSGQSGLRYAKNTSSANDVSQDMYKYVGIIDSPDTFNRVYSTNQTYSKTEIDTFFNDYTNAQVNALKTRVEQLESENKMLMMYLSMIIQKTGIEITDEDLENAVSAQPQVSDFGMMVDEIDILQNGMHDLQSQLAPKNINPDPYPEVVETV